VRRKWNVGGACTPKLPERGSGDGRASQNSLLGFLRDLQYSARSLGRSPGLATALLLTIALGLGSNVTVLGFIRGLAVSRSGFTPDARVVSVFARDRYRGAGPLSYDDYAGLRSLRGVEWVGAARVSQRSMKFGEQVEMVSVAGVTPQVARFLGLPVDSGIVLGRRFWQQELGAPTKIAGEAVQVAPEGLDGLYSDQAVDVWQALDGSALSGSERAARNVWVLAKLTQGTSAAGWGGEKLLALPYTGMAPDTSAGLARVETVLRVAAGFVFFIACVNVASFLLGRATLRTHETSIRVALGVSKWRLARALLADSATIAGAGAVLCALLARWTSQVIPSLLFESDAHFLVYAPGWASVVEACTGGAAVVAACGFLPWLQIRTERPAEVLGRQYTGPSRAARMARAVLVTAQMACCCLLATGTGYLFAGFRGAVETSAAHRLGRPIVVTAQAHRATNADVNYFRAVETAARGVPGMTMAAWAARLPGSEAAWREYRVEPQGLPVRRLAIDAAGLSPDGVDQFVWPPEQGRMFGYRDRGCLRAVVNEEAAAELFGAATAGRVVKDGAGNVVELIGVMSRKRGGKARPTIYYDDTNRPRVRAVKTEWYSAAERSELPQAELDANVVSANYFRAMGFTVTAGRTFSGAEGAHGCRVAVVNQEAADLYFDGRAVGAAIVDDSGERTNIIGVVHAAVLGAFARRAEPAVYLPMAQDCLQTMTMILGTSAAGSARIEDVKAAVDSVPGRGMMAPKVISFETYLRETALAPMRIAISIVGACAALAVFLAVLGLYGALSDAARARRREVAIRVAMGARKRHVIGQVLEEGGRLALMGTAAGLAGSAAVAAMVPRMMWGVGRPQWWVWAAGPLALAFAVAAASVGPARRSLVVDPMQVLRDN